MSIEWLSLCKGSSSQSWRPIGSPPVTRALSRLTDLGRRWWLGEEAPTEDQQPKTVGHLAKKHLAKQFLYFLRASNLVVVNVSLVVLFDFVEFVAIIH